MTYSLEYLRNLSFKELISLTDNLDFNSETSCHCDFKKEFSILEYLSEGKYQDDTPGYEAMWVQTSGTNRFFITTDFKLGLVDENQTGIYLVKIFEDLSVI